MKGSVDDSSVGQKSGGGHGEIGTWYLASETENGIATSENNLAISES